MSNTLDLKLPNGFKGPGGVIIRDIAIRKLDGDDEDMLRDKDNLRKGNVLDKLLKRVIVQMGEMDDPTVLASTYDNAFLLADVTYVLIKLRSWSIDPVYRFDYQCTRCGHHNSHRINLDTLHLDEQKEEHRGLDEYEAQVGDYTITFRPLYVRDGKMMETIRTEYKKEKGTRELMLQVKTVNGAKPHPQLLKKMDWQTRNKIRQAIDKTSGGIDTELVMECSRCEHIDKDTMPVQMKSFFFPAEDTSPSQEAMPFRDYGTTSRSLDLDGDGLRSQSAG